MPAESTEERISAVRRSLEKTRAEICPWFKSRQASDKQGQYVTHLGILKNQIGFLLGKVENQLGDVTTGGGPLSVYSKCRAVEKRLLWVRRLWTYFQTKFDQRRDPATEALLKAADEIVWSCYKQPFRKAGVEKSPPHPLPFVSAVYSPYAIPREEPPPELRSDVDAEFLTSMLKQMPIPVTGIQSLSLEEPWWLAYLAHEVGHHVQFDFDGGSLLGAFAQTLNDAGGNRWVGWSLELFADVYSLLMIGPWALWALAELVWSEPAVMLDDTNSRYPSALVRLMFMREVANQLQLQGTDALRGFTAADVLNQGPVMYKTRDFCDTAKDDLKKVEQVAKLVAAATYGSFGSLAVLGDFKKEDFLSGGDAYLWGEMLAGRDNVGSIKALRSARLVLSGGVQAWKEIREVADSEERATRRLKLKEDLLATIFVNREEITRAADRPETADLDRRNQDLADLLMSNQIPGLGL